MFIQIKYQKSTKDTQNVETGNGASKTQCYSNISVLNIFFVVECYKDILSSQGQSEFKMRRQLNPRISSLLSVEIFTVFLQHINALFSERFHDVFTSKSSIKPKKSQFSVLGNGPIMAILQHLVEGSPFPPYWCACSRAQTRL